MVLKEQLKKISDVEWQLPKGAVKGMRVPALAIVSEKLLKGIDEGPLEQIANVATLPGIYKHAIALPDMHFGYSR
ncbi:MAG: hypothetical protein ACE5FW_02610 [Candidatus Aenigmatarchaeota archaeon]